MTDHATDKMTNPPVHKAPSRRLLLRGESTIASLSMAMAAILVAALLGCGLWLVHHQRQTLEQARHSQLVAVADVMAGSAEALLSADELTAVRRMLMAAADEHRFSRARIVLPDNGVLADADASRITVDHLPAQWQDDDHATLDRPTTAISAGMLVIQRPLRINHDGRAQLELIADLAPGAAGDSPPRSHWETQAGVGAIGVAGLLALLLTYRHFRGRMQAIGVIREALLALKRGERAEAALAVADNLGDEAVAWNQLLSEQRELREQAAVQTVREALADDLSGDDLAQACDAVSHGLLLVDDHNRIRYANHAVSVFLQLRREQLNARPVRDVLHAAQLTDLADLIEQTATGRVRRKSTREIDRDATGAGVLRVSVHPIRGSHGATVMVVLEDVTQQRVAEQSSRQFVAQATHELRTPLTNIRLYLETLIEDETTNDPKTRANCLNVINQETHRLERLVGDMLSVAEIEAGSLQVSQDDVRIDKLLNAIETEYKAQAADKKITLAFKIPPKLPIVQGDRDKLAMALHNLVGNALKYTPEGGVVNVSVDAEDDKLTVDVTDSGLGIAPEDQPRIFDRFYRAQDKRISSINGSGLGLALAREVVRLHGGDITVESQIDQGSTFTLTVPAHEDAATATE
ncbi:MAG: ATP-binding protein [Phycisphaeraceae bacterium]